MKCLKCGEELDEGAIFCTSCGYKVRMDKCPKCKAQLDGNEIFCSNCGYKLNNGVSPKNTRNFITNTKSKGLMNKINTKVPNPLANKQKQRNIKNKPLGALLYAVGNEASVSIFEDHVELDYTQGSMPNIVNNFSNLISFDYSQLFEIRMTDGVIHGSLGFKLASNEIYRIKIPSFYQEEINQIYDFVNNKIQENKSLNGPVQLEHAEESTYIKNVKLLTEKGIGGHMYRGGFIEFLEKQNLSFGNDLLTQSIVDKYFEENVSLKNQAELNKQKTFRNAYDHNKNILKENGFGGTTERGDFIRYMNSKLLDFNNDKITQEFVEEYIDENPHILKNVAAKTKPKGALYFIDGREGTLSVFPDYIELNFTGSLMKKWLSHMGGVKRIYYHQINSIQKRDVGSFTTGTLEFELPGIVRSREYNQSNTENVIHYDKQWQEEANKIYEYVNNKILQLHNPNYRQPSETENTNDNSSLSQIKEAKELLDMGAITQEEFDEIKRNVLNQL